MTFYKTVLNTSILCALSLSSNAYSGGVNDSLNELHTRLHKLETSAKESTIPVEIHGALEVEYSYGEDYSGDDSSDIALATLELAIEVGINDNVDIQLSLLHEEDDTPVEVDVGVIKLHDESSPISLSAGQLYVPFGSFESNMISDPLTLELGEARESAILLNYEVNGLNAGLYVFNGDVEQVNSADKATKYGVSLSFENDNYSAGVDYISSISDTDSIQDYLSGTSVTVIDQVAGLAVHATYTMDSVSAMFEYLSAMESFDATEISFKGNGAEPSAMNLEFAIDMPVAGNDGTLALAIQSTEEAAAFGAPETRTLLSYSTDIYESTTLAFEFSRDADYSIADGGTDKNAETFTVMLATEF